MKQDHWNLASLPDEACHLCGAAGLEELVDFRQLRRITSDCRPWPAGGRLCVCTHCGSVQKIVDAIWDREVEELYAGYAIYHQAEGSEQAVFDPASGEAASRSQRLLARLQARLPLPESGRVLDVGCGNGATLRAFSQIAPGWSLAGTELNDKYRSQIEAIPGVEALYTTPPEDVSGTFTIVSMVHVLEHIPFPKGFLEKLRGKVDPGGLLVVELPHHVANPFELLIADHCTHFSAATATALLEASGFELVCLADDWVPKELSIVARNPPASGGSRLKSSDHAFPAEGSPLENSLLDCAGQRILWLKEIAGSVRDLAAKHQIGLFGTSIAATWLQGELDGAAHYFVDEDPGRVGKTCLGRPILHPSQIAAGSHVFMPLPLFLAEAIRTRLARPGVTFHLPPAM